MSYLKGKDIKQKGDCLVYCFIKNGIQSISERIIYGIKRPAPEGFEKW